MTRRIRSYKKEQEQVAARVEERITIPREDYDRFLKLQELTLEAMRIKERQEDLLRINAEQLNRLQKTDLEITHLRTASNRVDDRYGLVEARAADLEKKLEASKQEAAVAVSKLEAAEKYIQTHIPLGGSR